MIWVVAMVLWVQVMVGMVFTVDFGEDGAEGGRVGGAE